MWDDDSAFASGDVDYGIVLRVSAPGVMVVKCLADWNYSAVAKNPLFFELDLASRRECLRFGALYGLWRIFLGVCYVGTLALRPILH